MENEFFTHPIINFPYESPAEHWELDEDGQPTQKKIHTRRIKAVTDDSDLEEVYNTERQLLYVACTRARDHLLVTAVEPPSEFSDDLRT
jgi:ATP-dependent exoDNAse (exonuclease V) beta subunit